MRLNRIVVFALFWMAVGMLLMIFIRFRIVGLLIALVILLICFFLRHECW
ncbi:MAG: hypothetical protein IKC46_07795 [Lachnospiraceae bacterium]|nr:hypothetical protein [Lachnospiraceae bacterium]